MNKILNFETFGVVLLGTHKVYTVLLDLPPPLLLVNDYQTLYLAKVNKFVKLR